MNNVRKKWFGRAVMLALACFLFLGLKDSVAAKADDPDPVDAEAKLIYANNLNKGNPTVDTLYSFDPADGYDAYAVYVTCPIPASRAAITLNSSTFPGENIDYKVIRIWDNDCEIFVDENYVNKGRLVLAGAGSYLTVGWSLLNRGGCPAVDKYDGTDTADAIAAYFNGFIFPDDDPGHENYWNDESVFIFLDDTSLETNESDPHFNKKVQTIDWDMSVHNLEIGDNTVVFLKDEGKLHISGSLRLGSDSYIESINDDPRLDITNPDAEIIGMSLYDYFGTTGIDALDQGDLEGWYYYTEQSFGGDRKWIWTKIPDDLGNSDVTAAAKKYIYAYADLDFDGDGDRDEDDLKFALASELLVKFRNSYGYFGLYGEYDKAPANEWGPLGPDAAILSSRIVLDDVQTISAKRADDSPEDITRYTATVTWGHTNTGEEIKGTVYVYQLADVNDLLICTDFNENTNTGNTFFVRHAFSDKTQIVDGFTNETFFTLVINVDSFGKVVAGGHGVSLYEKNTDTNLYTFQTVSYSRMKYVNNNGAWTETNPDTMVKIFTSAGRYFATAGEGEEKRFDFVSNKNGNAADDIWEAGGSSPVKQFIHNNKLHIKPLNSNSGAAAALKEVRLKDPALSRAVLINNDDPTDIIITFKSNFYDTVTFILVYNDGTDGEFTVEREGIIIQYTGLDGRTDKGRYWLDIYGEGEGKELNYTYDYATESFVVIATYYHSSGETGVDDLSLIITYDDDGSTEVISSNDGDHGFTGYRDGTVHVRDGRKAVDTTSFIIGFMKHDGDVNLGNKFTFAANVHTGGFSVQVVKAGYDAADSFGGAVAGSGKGKHWDGIANVSY